MTGRGRDEAASILTGVEAVSRSPFDYEGRRVMVTGSASGIGRATAELLGRLGAFTVGLDRSPCANEVDAFYQVDLDAPGSVRKAARAFEGPIDALFNCAGVSGGGAAPRQVIEINFLGTRLLTEEVLPFMPAGGAIVTVASLGGLGWERNLDELTDFVGRPTFEEGQAWIDDHPSTLERAYGFSKQALIYWSKVCCVPLARRGIRINTIGPGVTDTPMLVDSVSGLGEDYLDRIPKPLGRLSSPEEQAAVLAFFNSAAAGYVTGQNLWTDGGYEAGLLVGDLNPLPSAAQ